MRKLTLLLFIFQCVVPALATDLSVFAGWTDANSVGSGVEEIRLDNFIVFGVRHEKDFFVIFGFENAVAFSGSSVLTTAGQDDNGLLYTSNLVLNLPVRRVLPFVTWGVGLTHKFGNSFPDVGSSFTTNWGAGVKVRRIAGPVGLRFDYRRLSIHGVLDDTVKANQISAGIMFTP